MDWDAEGATLSREEAPDACLCRLIRTGWAWREKNTAGCRHVSWRAEQISVEHQAPDAPPLVGQGGVGAAHVWFGVVDGTAGGLGGGSHQKGAPPLGPSRLRVDPEPTEPVHATEQVDTSLRAPSRQVGSGRLQVPPEVFTACAAGAASGSFGPAGKGVAPSPESKPGQDSDPALLPRVPRAIPDNPGCFRRRTHARAPRSKTLSTSEARRSEGVTTSLRPAISVE